MHELGIRVALGAQRRAVVGLVVSQSIRFALLGAALGAVLALLAGRWLQPLLFRQSATDPIVYAGVSATMLIVALVACGVPGVRAARADPITALRAE